MRVRLDSGKLLTVFALKLDACFRCYYASKKNRLHRADLTHSWGLCTLDLAIFYVICICALCFSGGYLTRAQAVFSQQKLLRLTRPDGYLYLQYRTVFVCGFLLVMFL